MTDFYPGRHREEQEIYDRSLRNKGVSDVIRSLVHRYPGEAQDINNGECLFFAEKVVRLLGRDQSTFVSAPHEWQLERVGQTFDPTAPRHWFIYHNGRIYDAECSEGVERWQDLPFYNRRRW